MCVCVCKFVSANSYLALHPFIHQSVRIHFLDVHISGAHLLSSHGGDMRSWDDIIHCTLLNSVPAHQQPINVLQYAGGRVVSGSQDHTLKVVYLNFP